MYYRKDLSYLDKLYPTFKINVHDPNNIYSKNLTEESKKVLQMDYLTKTFKDAVILKRGLRGPKF